MLSLREFGNRGLAAQAVEDDADFLLGRYCLRVARRMSLTNRSDGVSDILDLGLMPTPQGVTMSPKSSVLPLVLSDVGQLARWKSIRHTRRLHSKKHLAFVKAAVSGVRSATRARAPHPVCPAAGNGS
jgi:hypothetical protein